MQDADRKLTSIVIAGGRVRLEDGLEGRDAVLVEVTDDGPGIPPDVSEKVFDPFFTTKPQGSGLGLAIVRKIVDAHEGRIDMTTVDGRGTKFRVTLPVEPHKKPDSTKKSSGTRLLNAPGRVD